MVDIQTGIVVNKPLHFVAEYAMNPDNAPEWYVNIKSVEWKTPKPLTRGSQIAFKAVFMGKTLVYVYEIIELIPDKKLVMRTADGAFPMETTYDFEAIDGSTTKMKLRNRGNPSGFSRFLSLFIKMMIRNANKKDLKKIREILQA